MITAVGILSLADIELGMIVGSDVINRNGLILLKSGQEITEKHRRILKIWGITEIDITGLDRKQVIDRKAGEFEPMVIERTNKKVDQIFKHNDRKHPFIKELCRMVTLRLVRDQ